MENDSQLEKLLSEVTEGANVLENIRNLLESVVTKIDHGARGTGGQQVAPAKEAAGGLRALTARVGEFTERLNKAALSLLSFAALPVLATAAVGSFVGALNPGLMEHLNQLLNNLSATIGYAFEPVMAGAAEIVRQWTSMLVPLVRELQPVLRELMEAISAVLLPVLQILVDFLRIVVAVLKPVIAVFSAVAKVIGAVLDVFGALIETIFDTIGEFLSATGIMELFNEILGFFKRVIHAVVEGLTWLGAALLKLVGAIETLAKLRMAVERRVEERRGKTAGMVAAPKDAGVTGVEDIARRLSERAFTAQRGAVAKTDNELLDSILDILKEVESTDVWSKLADTIGKAIRDAIDKKPTGSSAVVGTVGDESSSVPTEESDDARTARRIGNAAQFVSNPLGYYFSD